MGGEGHQRERHRARLYREQQHPGPARRPRPQRRDPRPHPRRPLGQALRYRRRRGVPGERRRRLHARRDHPRRRRLAGTMTDRLNSFFQHDAELDWEPTEPGVKRKIMAYGEDLMVVRVDLRGRRRRQAAPAPAPPGLLRRSPACSTSPSTASPTRLTAGDTFFVPSDLVHGVVARRGRAADRLLHADAEGISLTQPRARAGMRPLLRPVPQQLP